MREMRKEMHRSSAGMGYGARTPAPARERRANAARVTSTRRIRTCGR